MLKEGFMFQADGRQYTVRSVLGSGANTVAYLAECSHGGLTANCILKEYAPRGGEHTETGKARFLESGRTQNQIRQISTLNNQTPPVSHVFEANGTAYIDVACYSGTTLSQLDSLSLPQYMALCETVAKTVGYYHSAGFLCLDLKPDNIFILQNAPDDTVTQLVEFIDFDSIRNKNRSGNALFSYTREWAAPEQMNPYASARIGVAADIYAVGEIVFFLLFGRHSLDSEHRGFSEFPFAECRGAFRRFTERPDVQALFTALFRGTIRSSAANRFRNMDAVTARLRELNEALNRKDYVIPVLPSVSPDFVGREAELRQIAEHLQESKVLYVTGVGGIGKSTLVRNYIARHRTAYGVIVYLEFDGDFLHTFCDDLQLQISTVSQQEGESTADYFLRKFKAFRRICGEERVLFVLDNFSGRLTKDLSRITDCGYDTVIVTRSRPPKNSFTCMEIGAISDTQALYRLIALNLGRNPAKEERLCFAEIISLVQGHTLVLELIARQIAAGRLDVHTALGLIRENGFSRFSGEKIGNYKDGEEVSDTLFAIVTALFDAGRIREAAKHTLKVLSLLNVRGLEQSLLLQFFPDIAEETLAALSAEGWICTDARIRLHPVIAEAVRGWPWSAEDVAVMDCHKKMTDIYVGMANHQQIREILREAERFRDQHPRHIISGMYFDMRGCYFDTLLNGAYCPENEEEAALIGQMIDSERRAISEMEQSSDSRKLKYLIPYLLSLANILIRSAPEQRHEAAVLLERVSALVAKDSADQCYYCMVSAWYCTLAEPDLAKTRALTAQAEQIARKVFPTDLELIDIIHIPAANCFYYHNDLRGAARKIREAAEICRKHPGTLPFIDKEAELLNILLDIHLAMNDKAECRVLIAEIDRIHAEYGEQGICREVSPAIREQVQKP